MRLIDLDELTADSALVIAHIALIKECKMRHFSGCAAPDCKECFARLFKYSDHLFNIIEVEQIKHGKWIRYDEENICSESHRCNFTMTFYCPNCGAKMEEKDED